MQNPRKSHVRYIFPPSITYSQVYSKWTWDSDKVEPSEE